MRDPLYARSFPRDKGILGRDGLFYHYLLEVVRVDNQDLGKNGKRMLGIEEQSSIAHLFDVLSESIILILK